MDKRVTPLKVLMIEDSPADAELVLRVLRELDTAVQHLRVANESALMEAFGGFGPDIILSDFSMPGFSGQEALKLAREHAPNIPFLFVSGTIGEELAIDALQRGAMDYVLKDNLRRLPSAIERALGIARERRERQRMEQALRDSEERFRTIVETSQDWIWENDREARVTYSNGAVQALLGYTPEEVCGVSAFRLLHEDDRAEVMERMPQLVAARQGWRRWRLRWRHRDGSLRVLESTAMPLLDEHGEVAGFRGIDTDVTERLQHEARIRHLARIHAVLSALGNSILRSNDRDDLMHQVCRVAVEQGGFRAACVGQPSADQALAFVAGYGDPQVVGMIRALGEHQSEEDWAQRPGIRAIHEGRKVVIRDFTETPELPDWYRTQALEAGVAAQVALPIGNPVWGVLGLYADTVQEFDAEELALLQRLADEIDYAVAFLAKSERLEYLAYHNPVTGLPNRSGFREQVAPLLAGGVAVAVLDVQRFSHVNESRGRAFGDRLLRQIGERIGVLAGADAVLAHPEADSFLVAWPTTDDSGQALQRLEQLMARFAEAGFVIEGEELYLDLHGGLAIGPAHGGDAETLESNASAALAEAHKRRHALHAFSEELQGRATRRIELERDLRRALEAGEFELHYQPKFEAASQRLVGAEALLRWRQPGVGLVPPASFIPVLEDTGLIVAAGRWVMRAALETALAWRAHMPRFRVAVNVSARELRHARFLDECRALLGPHVDDQPIDIEVTESLLMDDIDHSVHLLNGLRDLGCRVAIDDFGTGYSSLNYLARLPTDEIKIDQSFVTLLAHSPETMGLVTNIITLAHSLSLKVVAEGVEEEEQAKLLRLLRCDLLQGYLLGRPVPAASFASQFLDDAY